MTLQLNRTQPNDRSFKRKELPMPVVIRMARAGTKKRPVYHIVAADSRSPRDGRFIERLGYFNPLLPKDKAERLKLDMDKVKAWIGQGRAAVRPRDALPRRRRRRQAREAQQSGEGDPAQGAQGRRAKRRTKAADAAKAEAKAKADAKAAEDAAAAPQPRRSRHVGRRDRPHLRCPDRRRARHSRRGAAAVVHRGPDGGRRPTVRWKARTARGASRSRRCGRRRITSWRGSTASATATRPRS